MLSEVSSAPQKEGTDMLGAPFSLTNKFNKYAGKMSNLTNILHLL